MRRSLLLTSGLMLINMVAGTWGSRQKHQKAVLGVAFQEARDKKKHKRFLLERPNRNIPPKIRKSKRLYHPPLNHDSRGCLCNCRTHYAHIRNHVDTRMQVGPQYLSIQSLLTSLGFGSKRKPLGPTNHRF